MAKLKERAFIVSVCDKNRNPVPEARIEVLIDNETIASATTIGNHTEPIRVTLSEDVTVVDLRAVVDGHTQRVTVDADVGTYTFAFQEVEMSPSANSPADVLRAAVNAVPAVKYALGVAGIAAAAALAASFFAGRTQAALLASAAMLVLMILLVLFARLTSTASKALVPAVLFMTWAILLLVIASAGLLVTSFFFDWPKPLETLFVIQATEAGSRKEPIGTATADLSIYNGLPSAADTPLPNVPAPNLSDLGVCPSNRL
jgi:hypothetical protein